MRNRHELSAGYDRCGLKVLQGGTTQELQELRMLLEQSEAYNNAKHPQHRQIADDVLRIYAEQFQPAQELTPAEARIAQADLELLRSNPAYADPSHADHARVTAQVRTAYEARHPNKE